MSFSNNINIIIQSVRSSKAKSKKKNKKQHRPQHCRDGSSCQNNLTRNGLGQKPKTRNLARHGGACIIRKNPTSTQKNSKKVANYSSSSQLSLLPSSNCCRTSISTSRKRRKGHKSHSKS